MLSKSANASNKKSIRKTVSSEKPERSPVGRRPRSRRADKAAPENGLSPNPEKPAPRLERTTFRTSREMDFFSVKELVTQTGHEIREWPLVILKELIDNALDACEEADVSPVLEMAADACGITVSDNGPGLPETTLKAALDFKIRASNREAYVSPCRGAQGNALKTVLPMPRVVDPDHGQFIVSAHGKQHVITCRVNPISQLVEVHDDVSENVKINGFDEPKKPSFFGGTQMRLQWSPMKDDDGNVIWPFDGLAVLQEGQLLEPSFADQFREMVEGFAVFNPHATIRLDWFGNKTTWEATDLKWQKWKPHRPTSSHWYELRHLERLIGAYITDDRDSGKDDRLVSDLIAEFDGLSGSLKRARVLDETDLKRVKLSELVAGDQFDSEKIAKLLGAMQRHTGPVKSQRLGIIGEDHLRKRLLAMGIKPESFCYRTMSSNRKPRWITLISFWNSYFTRSLSLM